MTADTAPGGLRERKKLRTEAAIRAAGLRLVREQGFDRTTIEEIAEAAEVSPSTLFRYFPTKEDLFIPRMELLAPVRQALDERPDDEAVFDTLRRALLEVTHAGIGTVEDELARFELVASVPAIRGAAARVFDEIETEIADAIRPLVGRGKQAELEARVVAAAVVRSVMIAYWMWGQSGGKESPTRLLRSAFDLFEAGIDRADS